MLLPFGQEIYRPILRRLEKEGIIARETIAKQQVGKTYQESVRY